MKKQKRIAVANLPTFIPLQATIVFWLLLDRLQAPQVVWGIFYTLAVIIWAGALLVIWNTESVDLFKKES